MNELEKLMNELTDYFLGDYDDEYPTMKEYFKANQYTLSDFLKEPESIDYYKTKIAQNINFSEVMELVTDTRIYTAKEIFNELKKQKNPYYKAN